MDSPYIVHLKNVNQVEVGALAAVAPAVSSTHVIRRNPERATSQ